MKYTVTKLPKSEVKIEFSVEPGELDGFLDEAAKKVSRETEIPGFRKGEAPRKILEEKLGALAIYERAAEKAVKQFYVEAVIAEKLEPVGRPDVTITKLAPHNPLEFTAHSVVIPAVTLPDWRKIAESFKGRMPEVKVTDAEVEGALEWLRKSRAKEGETPQADDDFARTIGKFGSIADLKKSIGEGMLREKTEKERQKLRISILEKIAAQSQMNIPEILAKHETEIMRHELEHSLGNIGLTLNDYLSKLKLTPEKLLEEFGPEAERRVKFSLTLRKIASETHTEATPKEIDAEVNKTLDRIPHDQNAKANIDPEELREYTKGALRNEKIFELFEKLAGVSV